MKKKLICLPLLLLAMVIVLLSVTFITAAEEDAVAEETMGQTMYRYREKIYTTSTEELEEPWVLYQTTTEYYHNGCSYKYLDAYAVNGTGTSSGYTYSEAYNWKLDNSRRYCFHDGPTEVYKFMKKTAPYSYKYVTNTNAIDLSQYSYVGKCWRFQCCTSKTEYLKYHYFKWSDWSEWSDTPVEESDNVEVEIQVITDDKISADINDDGVVDIADITAIINAASGAALDPAAYPGDTDLTADGVVDIGDIVAVINIASGIER